MRCLRADRLVVAVKPSEWGWSEGAGSLVNCSREQPGSFREETSGQVRFGRQAVCDTEAAGLGGVSESQGQQGCRRGGWAVHRRLRGGSEEQSVQDLESDVVGDLLSSCGDGGGDMRFPRYSGQLVPPTRSESGGTAVKPLTPAFRPHVRR